MNNEDRDVHELNDEYFEKRDKMFEQCPSLKALELELRKYDLQQIGYMLLSWLGEANHSNWDGVETEDLPKMEFVMHDLLLYARADEVTMQLPEHDWGFGGPEYWDSTGKRHLR